MNGERRLKKVSFYGDLPVSKYELIALLRKLPEDAKLTDTAKVYEENKSALYFESKEWDRVSASDIIPEWIVWVTTADMEDAKASVEAGEVLSVNGAQPPILTAHDPNTPAWTPPVCPCDLAYTGEKTHKPICPYSGKNNRA